jgi:hypothetical protein
MSFPSAFADWSHRATLTVPVVADDGILFGYLPMSKLPEEYWLNGDADGDDIRITEEDGETELAFYLPAAPNFSTDTGGIFIRLAGIASESVTADVTIYWGNIAASGAGDSGDVFAGYAAVYAPGMSAVNWVTGSEALTAENSPGTTTSGIEGMIAATYTGGTKSHWTSSVVLTGWPVTLEAIGESYDAANTGALASFSAMGGAENAFRIIFAGTVSGDPARAVAAGASGASTADTSSGYSTNTTHYVAGSRDANSGTTRAFIDGGSAGSNTTSLTTPTFTRFSTGIAFRTTSVNALDGEVTIALVSASVRSADFISTMHDMWTDADWWTVGEAEENESGPIEAGSTGWSPFQTAANVATGDVAWSNASHVLADDANAATCLLEDGETSQILRVVNPDFATPIPTGAVPNAVHFRLSRSGPTGSVEIRDILIRPVQGLTLAGDNKQANGRWESLATATFGGDLWGLSWDTVDWTEAGFAIRVECFSSGDDGTASAFFAEIKVDWPGDDVTANTRGFFALL